MQTEFTLRRLAKVFDKYCKSGLMGQTAEHTTAVTNFIAHIINDSVAAYSDMPGNSYVVSIHGPGGVGKSKLANGLSGYPVIEGSDPETNFPLPSGLGWSYLTEPNYKLVYSNDYSFRFILFENDLDIFVREETCKAFMKAAREGRFEMHEEESVVKMLRPEIAQRAGLMYEGFRDSISGTFEHFETRETFHRTLLDVVERVREQGAMSMVKCIEMHGPWPKLEDRILIDSPHLGDHREAFDERIKFSVEQSEAVVVLGGRLPTTQDLKQLLSGGTTNRHLVLVGAIYSGDAPHSSSSTDALWQGKVSALWKSTAILDNVPQFACEKWAKLAFTGSHSHWGQHPDAFYMHVDAHIALQREMILSETAQLCVAYIDKSITKDQFTAMKLAMARGVKTVIGGIVDELAASMRMLLDLHVDESGIRCSEIDSAIEQCVISKHDRIRRAIGDAIIQACGNEWMHITVHAVEFALVETSLSPSSAILVAQKLHSAIVNGWVEWNVKELVSNPDYLRIMLERMISYVLAPVIHSKAWKIEVGVLRFVSEFVNSEENTYARMWSPNHTGVYRSAIAQFIKNTDANDDDDDSASASAEPSKKRARTED